ncbi:MAG: HAMP domain-containing protein, partial [bacterium]
MRTRAETTLARIGIRRKVFFALLLPLLIFGAFSLTMFAVFYVHNHSAVERQNELKKSALEKAYSTIEEQTYACARIAAASNDVRLGVEKDFRHFVMRAIIPLFETFGTDLITVHEHDGYVIGMAHRPEMFGEDQSGDGIVAAALRGGTVRGIHDVEGRRAVITALPVASDDRTVGVCTAGFFLQDSFAKMLKEFVGAEIMIAEGDTVFASSLGAGKRGKDETMRIPRTKKRILLGRRVFDLMYVPLKKRREGDIGIFIAADNTHIYVSLLQTLVLFSLIAALIILVATRYSWNFSRAIARPIVKASYQAERVARGDLDVEPLEVVSSDETGRLTASFNLMVQNLRTMVEKDRERREYLEGEVSRLVEVIAAAADGDLSRRFEITRRDEFAKIGEALNRMTADLQARIEEDRRRREYLEREVGRLLEVMLAASGGDFTKSYDVKTGDEIGRLGGALNRMIGELKDMIDTAKRRRSHLEQQVSRLLEYIQTVASGDFAAVFDSERDDEFGRIGGALSEMMRSIRTMIEQ